jgi:arylformamidase
MRANVLTGAGPTTTPTVPRVRLLDVSMPIRPGMPSFPGDPAVATAPVKRIDRGDAYNLSTWSLGSHTGTHVDPPIHFVAGGATTDQLDLSVLNGPCRVVDVPATSREVGPAEVAGVPRGTTRVLFRTSNSARWAGAPRFFDDYVAVTDAGAAALLAAGICLVGLDALSVESDPSGRFPVHHRLLGGGALILEGLCLAPAVAGPYDLRCLPLDLVGGDGGPCRAVLATL